MNKAEFAEFMDWAKEQTMSDEFKITRYIENEPPKANKNFVEVVRCRECKYGEYREDFDDYECHASGCGLVYDADFFCADGEREGEW